MLARNCGGIKKKIYAQKIFTHKGIDNDSAPIRSQDYAFAEFETCVHKSVEYYMFIYISSLVHKPLGNKHVHR